MKKIILPLLVLLLASCEKESGKNEIEITEINTRITEQIIIHSAESGYPNEKNTYTYDGSNLVQETRYEREEGGEWKEIGKREMLYEGNAVTTKNYSYQNYTWLLSGKVESLIQDGKVLERIGYSLTGETWSIYSKQINEYEGSNLSSAEWLYDYDKEGQLKPNSLEEYYYENGLLKTKECSWYDNSSNAYKKSKRTVYEYENKKKITETDYTNHNEVFEPTYKIDYSYSNEKIIISYSNWATEWLFDYSEEEKIDSFGNVIESGTTTKHYTEYEQAEGNAELFIY